MITDSDRPVLSLNYVSLWKIKSSWFLFFCVYLTYQDILLLIIVFIGILYRGSYRDLAGLTNWQVPAISGFVTSQKRDRCCQIDRNAPNFIYVLHGSGAKNKDCHLTVTNQILSLICIGSILMPVATFI